MSEPPSPTVGATSPAGVAIQVVGADEQQDVVVEVDRWCRLATAVLAAEGRHGELTLTFVDRDEIAALNAEHLGQEGPTDVLSFPLDSDADGDVPCLLGDIVICPAVATAQAPAHAGDLDDELALLVVHGILHVLGHDHVDSGEAAFMQARELEHLQTLHWHGVAPTGFRQEHVS